jgi:CPA2 family monovalent cation:H+ antiporter-2
MSTDFLIVIAAGFCGGLLARLLRQPLVLGYLVAGVVVGPHTGGITVSDPQNLERLAEIGATLLLFGLGLELSLADLRPVRRVAVLGTPIQILLTVALGAPLGRALGFGWTESLWLGALVSLSSTLVVLKALQSQGRMGTLSSRVMIGMLVAQDLAFIPLMILLPWFGASQADPWAIAAAAVKVVIAAVLLLGPGSRLVPRVVELVARSGSRELFLLVTISIALGIGWLAHLVGISPAVGAFVAGLLLSESDYSHQALSDIIPLRDVFSVLFFASVGMLLDPSQVAEHWRSIAGLVVTVTLIKGAVFSGVTRAFGYRNVVPLASALALFQVGEFSFVLARTGLSVGAISQDLYGLVLDTAVITMVLTPVISGLTPHIYGWISRRRGTEPVQTINTLETGLSDHVIVAGAGRVGCGIADVLRRLDLPVILIELDHGRIDHVRENGRPVVFGDAAQPPVLEAAGIDRARLLLVTIPVLGVARAIIEHARRLNPGISVVARAESGEAMSTLHDMDVAEVVQPETEASLEMTRQALLHLRLPALDILQLTDELRESRYRAMFERHAEHYPALSRLAGATRLLDLRWVRVAEGSAVDGKTIGEFDVRAVTGASIVGLLRSDSFEAGPGPDACLRAGDLVAVVGDRPHIDRFEEAAAGRREG